MCYILQAPYSHLPVIYDNVFILNLAAVRWRRLASHPKYCHAKFLLVMQNGRYHSQNQSQIRISTNISSLICYGWLGLWRVKIRLNRTDHQCEELITSEFRDWLFFNLVTYALFSLVILWRKMQIYNVYPRKGKLLRY